MIDLHERWTHDKSGATYSIITTAMNEADLTPVVVYRCENTGATWVRPMKEFFDGRFLPLLPPKGARTPNSATLGDENSNVEWLRDSDTCAPKLSDYPQTVMDTPRG